jgi:hypothetical protein
MSEHVIKLSLRRTGAGSTVELDGRMLECVRAVTVHASVDSVTSVTMELVPSRVEIEVQGDAQVTDVTSLGEKIRRFEFR